jgi:lysophospholipase L1-like esterase
MDLQSLYAQAKGPERWEEAIQKFEKSDQANPPSPGSNLFVGSSSITIWTDIDQYFPGYAVLNRGFGGSQFSDLLFYVDRVIIPYSPAKIFIYEGDNDIAAGKKPATVLKQVKSLRKIIAKKLPGVPVVFISVKPSVARWHLKEQYEAFNTGLEAYAKKTRLTEFVDVWSAMLDEQGKVYTSIFREDNLHMNPEGYKLWQPVLMPYLAR